MKKISIIIMLIGGFFFNKYGVKGVVVTEEPGRVLSVTTQSGSDKSTISTTSSYGKTLKIVNSRCVSCTKCARIAPENFVMNLRTGLAEVASQNNLNSVNVSQAIRVCPTRAINM